MPWRNKEGREYGFVKFFKVEDVKGLEKKLDKIYIGNMELFVNLPKYNRLKIVEKRITHHEQLHTGNREKKSNGDETKKK